MCLLMFVLESPEKVLKKLTTLQVQSLLVNKDSL